MLLTAALAPALGARPVRPRCAAWGEAVAGVRSEVLAWVAKSERKHLPHGYPLAALLLCLEEEGGAGGSGVSAGGSSTASASAAPQLRAFVEGPLPRALRERPSRGAALECLRTAARFYGAHTGRPPPGGDALWQAIAAAVAQLPAALRRTGGIAARSEPEQADCLADICAAVAQVEPSLALEQLLPELIAPRGEPALGDGPAAGLRALAACCAVAGAGPPRGGGAPLAEACAAGLAQALARLRQGGSALGELGIGGALPAPLRAALGAAARAAAAALPAAAASAAAGKPAQDGGGAAAALTALLGCVPYAVADEWRGARGAEALCPFARSRRRRAAPRHARRRRRARRAAGRGDGAGAASGGRERGRRSCGRVPGARSRSRVARCRSAC